MSYTNIILAAALSFATSLAGATEAVKRVDPVRVSNGWVRAPAPAQKTAGAYLDISSAGNAALVGAASPAAARVEMHATSTDGGVMRMRAIPRIELANGQTVKLAPNGIHLMLVDLTRPLKVGEKVPLTLTVQQTGAAAQTLTVELEVRAAAPGAHHHH